MIHVRCPRCLKIQKYQPKQSRITKKYKACVYCGKHFKIHSNEHLSRIVPQKMTGEFQTFTKLQDDKIMAKT
ncbi:hypothetical protein JW868_04845 [Candidatus Woesearchaeota archaeon]|nr:hypothetical protein [Candidatus Woesearchaeota archaeon]